MIVNRRKFILSSISIAFLVSFPKLAFANCDSDYQLDLLKKYVPSVAVIAMGVVGMMTPGVGVIALPLFLAGVLSLANKMRGVNDEATTDVMSKIKNFYFGN